MDRDERKAPPAIFLPSGEYRTFIAIVSTNGSVLYGITYYFIINQWSVNIQIANNEMIVDMQVPRK